MQVPNEIYEDEIWELIVERIIFSFEGMGTQEEISELELLSIVKKNTIHYNVMDQKIRETIDKLSENNYLCFIMKSSSSGWQLTEKGQDMLKTLIKQREMEK